MGIKLWELVKWCAEGAYVDGEKFVNGEGLELLFDGEELLGLEGVPVNSIWFHWSDGYTGLGE